MSVPSSFAVAAVRFYKQQPTQVSDFDNPVRPALVITSSGTFWHLVNGTSVQSITLGGTSGAASWGTIIGTLSNQTDLQTELTNRVTTSQATNYAWTSTLGTAASTAASTYLYAVQGTNYAWNSTLGTAASTASSTYGLAAQTSNYAWNTTLPLYETSTNATNYAWSSSLTLYSQTSHRHDATHITSGVFDLARLASTGTPGVNTYLRGDSTWASPVRWVNVTSVVPGITVTSAAVTASSLIYLNTSTVFVPSQMASTGTASTDTFLTGSNAWHVPILRYTSSVAGATIALGTNVFSTVASVSVSSGAWFFSGLALCGHNISFAAYSSVVFTGKITDGTNTIASGQMIVDTGTSTYATLGLSGVFRYGAASTVNFQIAPTTTNTFVRAQAWQNAAGSTGTLLTAIRIG